MHHRKQENFKKSRPKKLVKSNKSISRNFVSPNSNFYYFKNGQKSSFELGKKFKTAKNAISRKKIDLFDFTAFFAWTFLNFLARCVLPKQMFILFFKVQTYLERTLDLGLVSIPHHLFVCELSATKIIRQTTPCAILQNPLLDFRDKEEKGTRRRRSPSRLLSGSLFEILRNFWHSNKICSGNGGEILHRRRVREGESQDRRAYDEIKLAISVILGLFDSKGLKKIVFSKPIDIKFCLFGNRTTTYVGFLPKFDSFPRFQLIVKYRDFSYIYQTKCTLISTKIDNSSNFKR